MLDIDQSQIRLRTSTVSPKRLVRCVITCWSVSPAFIRNIAGCRLRRSMHSWRRRRWDNSIGKASRLPRRISPAIARAQI